MTIKTLIKKACIASLSLIAFSSSSFAASCDLDVAQMISQIQQYHSISTRNGVQVQQVGQPTEEGNNHCNALGSSFKRPIKLKWTKGNWGNTLYAKF